jgi:hypothetical protein
MMSLLDHSPGWPGQKMTPYLKNNQSKKVWRHGLSGRGACLASKKPCVQSPVKGILINTIIFIRKLTIGYKTYMQYQTIIAVTNTR